MAGRNEQGSSRLGKKESRAAMSRKEDEEMNNKGEEKEREAEKFGQQFCRQFLAPESGERLRIPAPFSQYLENQPTGLVFLKGQSGSKWLVELCSDNEGLFFGHGWKEFVVDHSIEAGHILTFCYDGYSQFSVVVFDGMCIEKPSAFHAKPSKEISGATQEENMAASLNSTEEPDSSNRVLEESICRKDSSKSSPIFRFSKAVDTFGKTVLKIQRVPEVMSQRQPVSEVHKNYALQKARQYKSKYPITLQIMKETNVYRTFFMIIPCEFVREYLPQTEKELTLWDPQRKAWKVTYVYCSQRSPGAFSGGWGKFSLGNHLEESDVCVFELFSKDNIKVHIYRANPTLSLYILESDN
ncbi:unnamed protein product [Alopecurus aequalis]